MSSTEQKTILLVHPLGYSARRANTDVARMANIMPPLGLASISAYLEQYDIYNDIIDCYAHPQSDELIFAYLRRYRPPYIAFSCTTSSFYDGIRLAREVRRIDPQTTIIFGGVHVSAMREEILVYHDEVDVTVVGEGEETLKHLLQDGDNPSEVAGICYRGDNGHPQFSGYRKNQLNLDDLPFPAYEKLTGYPEVYELPIFNYPATPNTSCISSRGCPYSCSYCDRSVFRRSFRYNSADYLYRHMRYLNERFGIRHINFYDDQFTFNRKRVEEFTALVKENPLGMTFNCAARAEHLDYDLLVAMKSAGCWMISLGIETGDPDLLARHRQNPDLEMMREKILLIKKAGIRVKGLLMMGLPGETEESIRKSQQYVFSLPIDDFNLAKFTPFPGSPVYKEIKEADGALGTFTDDLERMDCMQFLFIPKGISAKRLEELFVQFYKKHFQRPRVLWGYVTMLWKSPDSWRRFLGNLGGFLTFIKTNRRIQQ
ncbi:MAG: radical SAM protein [Desulfocapsaceae bacterium]|nr:radical SAM protein [Desulfocapsaceae bacterium]